MAYLHELVGIVHGDLKGVGPTFPKPPPPRSQVDQANILVDNEGTARVGDFGLMTMVDPTMVFLSETDVSSGGTFCWMSPELLDPLRFGSDGRSTCGSDCYALGMVIYEVFYHCTLHGGPLLTHPRF